MKKLLAIFTVVIVMTLGLAVPVAAQTGDIASLEKTFDVESVGLCDYVTGNIVIETLAPGVVVTDEMPDGLALTEVTVSAAGVGTYILNWDDDSIEVTLNDIDVYTISFEAQVTDVLSYDSIVVTNQVSATDSAQNVDTASDDLELLPYISFGKSFEGAWLDGISGSDPVDQYAIPVNTKVYFLMYVDGANTLGIDMLGAYVKDNLGGDLMLDDWDVSTGSYSIPKLSGNTKKAHLLWEIGDVVSGEGFMSDLAVSTDTNTGTGNGKKDGHQEYTDEEPTVHELNSGATLKFTASDTGFTCSVSSVPVEIQTILPE